VSPSAGRLDARAIALAVLAMAILGGSYSAGKVALVSLPLFGLLALRMLLTAGTLGVYVWRARLPLAYRGRSVAYIAGHSVFFIASQVLLFTGLTMTGAGRAAILFNMQPFFTLILLPLFVRGERASARGWLGTAIAFAGVALVLAERGLEGGAIAGDLLCLVAALGWTGSVILNRSMPGNVNAPSVIFWNAVVALPILGLASLALEPASAWQPTPAALASLAYLGVLAGGVGFVLVVWLMRTYVASRVNVFMFLMPVFGVLAGWALLGEPLGLLQLLGAAAVALGILVVSTER
jgi:drug/metabolite transporter (DMT)-like permease